MIDFKNLFLIAILKTTDGIFPYQKGNLRNGSYLGKAENFPQMKGGD